VPRQALIVSMALLETVQGSCRILKDLHTRIAQPLVTHHARAFHAKTLNRTAMVVSRSPVIGHMKDVNHHPLLLHHHHHKQLECKDTLTNAQIVIALPLTFVSTTLQLMVTTGRQLAKILISSMTSRPLRDRSLIQIPRGRDHIVTLRKRAMRVLSAKKKRMLNNASGSIQKSPMLIGKSFVACFHSLLQRLIFPSRRW
jgi:hypothetical protein